MTRKHPTVLAWIAEHQTKAAEKMTAQLASRALCTIAGLAFEASDGEAAHTLEQKFFAAVFKHLSCGTCEDVTAVARIARATSELNYPRYY